jgi:hypothetical protein
MYHSSIMIKKTHKTTDNDDYKIYRFKKSGKPKGTISCIFLLIIILIILYGWYCT